MKLCGDCVHFDACIMMLDAALSAQNKKIPERDRRKGCADNCECFQPCEDYTKVVRCENCKYSREDKESTYYGCTLYRDMRKGSDFCNYGERKGQK